MIQIRTNTSFCHSAKGTLHATSKLRQKIQSGPSSSINNARTVDWEDGVVLAGSRGMALTSRSPRARFRSWTPCYTKCRFIRMALRSTMVKPSRVYSNLRSNTLDRQRAGFKALGLMARIGTMARTYHTDPLQFEIHASTTIMLPTGLDHFQALTLLTKPTSGNQTLSRNRNGHKHKGLSMLFRVIMQAISFQATCLHQLMLPVPMET